MKTRGRKLPLKPSTRQRAEASELPLPTPPRNRHKTINKEKKIKRCSQLKGITTWDIYRKNINHLVLNVQREEHCCSTLSMQRSSASIRLVSQISASLAKIRLGKERILEQFAALKAENTSHKRHAALASADDDGMVDLELINCSR
jgi:hypothetical protein